MLLSFLHFKNIDPTKKAWKMKKNIQRVFICFFLFLFIFPITGCSYIKMAFQNQKEMILKKISPFYRQYKPDEQDFSKSIPQYTSDYHNLNDPVFQASYGEEGLFFPDNFLKHIKYNFYLLGSAGKEKIPVVFVHGAGGTPIDWKYLLENINHDKFCPIVFYYPTGIRLNISADILYKGIKEIHKYYGPVILIAHSMGGLISRNAIRRLTEDNLSVYVPLYISLSTPYGGHIEAQDGIEHLPESAIVPSWRDIASKSDYIKRLYDFPIPPETDFRLFFGYSNPKRFRIGPNSDGSITIKSQLDPRAQKEANRLYGFDDDHETILKDPEVMSIINEILEKNTIGY